MKGQKQHSVHQQRHHIDEVLLSCHQTHFSMLCDKRQAYFTPNTPMLSKKHCCCCKESGSKCYKTLNAFRKMPSQHDSL
ncbi:CLUMA_CG006432, isoform A [Clunio marinus]|uniref:CLUMA_CG006432, isoform A n=1 Tax=Clunio marinus TaxID=568069 RepID=A0A1J1HZ39_9DIPT|nr:CLUMA_CG006432, isoform A [Clunio marinus]